MMDLLLLALSDTEWPAKLRSAAREHTADTIQQAHMHAFALHYPTMCSAELKHAASRDSTGSLTMMRSHTKSRRSADPL